MDLANRRQGLKRCIVCLFVLRDVIETLKESSWFGNEGAMDYGDSDGDGGAL